MAETYQSTCPPHSSQNAKRSATSRRALAVLSRSGYVPLAFGRLPAVGGHR